MGPTTGDISCGTHHIMFMDKVGNNVGPIDKKYHLMLAHMRESEQVSRRESEQVNCLFRMGDWVVLIPNASSS